MSCIGVALQVLLTGTKRAEANSMKTWFVKVGLEARTSPDLSTTNTFGMNWNPVLSLLTSMPYLTNAFLAIFRQFHMKTFSEDHRVC